MEIVSLTQQPNKDAIELLEETIERIKSGEIESVAISWTTKNGMDNASSAGPNQILLWASIYHHSICFYEDVIKQARLGE